MEAIYIFTDRRVDKEDVVQTYIPYNGILISHKKNQIMSWTTAWVQLEIIVPSKVSQKEKDKSYMILLYVWNLKYSTYELIYKTETD